MPFTNALMQRLGLSVPIIQAPMLGATGTAIVRAVSGQGGLGTLAAGALAPSAITDAIDDLKKDGKPFAANLLIVPKADPDSETVERAVARLATWRRQFGLAEDFRPNRWSEDFRSQLDALIAAAPPAASFTFDLLSRDDIAAMKARGTYVMGTATDVSEARAWADAGADAIIAQGYEAGGHHGAFLSDGNEAAIGTFALVPAIKRAVALPVIAAGGIMDGAGIAAALLLGADAVQMGTAFLLSPESIISTPWREALRQAGDDVTRLTRVYSGRYARGIANRFWQEMRTVEKDIPPYPVQNALTGELRAASAKAGSAEALSLWAGQGVNAIREIGSAELVDMLWHETKTALAEMQGRVGS
ncbi:MAG TPA: nitronate monooxygenase [Rhizomicrobium sp.]|jgi:nitronate monooxygenase|nr:nitronate monooxygenase [Rhizomicrobium sp.]